MKKLYYKDPLAAAYMANKFGVRLFRKAYCESTDREEAWLDWDVDDCCNDEVFERYKGESIYIHPDSYHIFELMDGDLLRFFDKVKKIEYIVYYGGKDVTNYQIAQRGDNPFFWPESEEEDE